MKEATARIKINKLLKQPVGASLRMPAARPTSSFHVHAMLGFPFL
ncbi:MAG: hypothetical protein WCO56_11890 [Verrucomicrobiota bacterium]